MLKQIKSKWNKIKGFVKDMFFNTFSFGLYIIAQQIVFMPIMGNCLSTEEFSKIVIYISIFSIISNTLGSELGITRQVKEDNQNNKIYNKILLCLVPIIVIISFITLILLKFNFVDSIMFTISILLANIRLYCAAYFRLNKCFKNVLIQNLLYFIGILIGIGIFKITNLVWIPMLLAEIVVLIFNLFKADILKNKSDINVNNKEIYKTFSNLSFISLLVNGMVYFDKILIYPILGESAVAVYYATTSMSKIINLIINPVHGVMLSWIKTGNKKEKNKLVKATIKINIPVIILIFIISLPLTYLATRILYVQYLEQAKTLIIPVCIGLAFSAVTSIIKALLLKYTETKKMTISYLIYFGIFILAAIPMSKLFGLIGFAWANVIAKIFLWIEFLIILNNSK